MRTLAPIIFALTMGAIPMVGGWLCGQADARQVAKCEARAGLAERAGQSLYAAAWRAEAERARAGQGCRDNINAAGVISED
jgi:hypothetical protein